MRVKVLSGLGTIYSRAERHIIQCGSNNVVVVAVACVDIVGVTIVCV